MKNFVIMSLLAFSINSFGIEKLSTDASNIASILMDRQLSECILEFQKQSAQIREITKDKVDGIDLIKITGMSLIGGDIPKDLVEMNIKTEYVPAPIGFGMVPVYKCQVQVNKI